jgi:hypothetical protein
LQYVDDDRPTLDGEDTDTLAADAVVTLKLREEVHRPERDTFVTFAPMVGVPMDINNDDLNDRTVILLTRNFIVRCPTAAAVAVASAITLLLLCWYVPSLCYSMENGLE